MLGYFIMRLSSAPQAKKLINRLFNYAGSIAVICGGWFGWERCGPGDTFVMKIANVLIWAVGGAAVVVGCLTVLLLLADVDE